MNLIEKLRKHKEDLDTVMKWGNTEPMPSLAGGRLDDENMEDYRERLRLIKVWMKHRSDGNYVNPKTGVRYEG